ncbi:MAG: class I SAM-dependent methyltransferase [Lachnospiraceae bacterium]|nr:class I SAM-dependent methyltransferase [Lachnospiraceae bacterium]
MVELIGNVKLNKQFYSGVDEYSDGDIEKEILELVKKESDVLKILKEDNRWPVLYHLSPERHNILEWYPFDKDAEVLEVGAGCGAVTGAICKKVKSVTCNDLSLTRSSINAYRNKEFDNLEIMVGNFNHVKFEKKYDYITLIGVLEYAGYYTEGNNPFVDFLKNIKQYLKEDGKVLIAIENKFGLKYWAGFREDHIGDYFVGLENYEGVSQKVRTFSKDELKDIFEEAGYSNYSFYYPYPDYKFPKQIFSDEYLPNEEDIEFSREVYDNNRMKLFNETRVLKNIVKNKKFDFFSNSFFIEISR